MKTKYQLLTNQTFLYVKSKNITNVVYSDIAKELGITRQTVAQEYKAVVDWNCLDIKNYHDEVSDKYQKAVKILKDLIPGIYLPGDISALLGVSIKTLQRHKAIEYT